MKKNIKISAVIIASTIVIGCFYYYSFYISLVSDRSLINFSIAKKEFATDGNEHKFQLRQQAIQDYYLSGVYEFDVKKIVAEAKNYFSNISVKSDSIIIFDVDDSAVYHYHRRSDTQFIWEKHPILKNVRGVNEGTAIEAVLDLFRFLVDRGFKIVFLTSRNAGSYDETLNELKKAGYLIFEKLILMPDEKAFDRTIKTADWKLDERKKLSQKYNIVGSVGDREADFVGGYTGYIVRLPNYLY